jgi:hypothetical protein
MSFTRTLASAPLRSALSRGMATRTKIVGGNWKCNAGNGVLPRCWHHMRLKMPRHWRRHLDGGRSDARGRSQRRAHPWVRGVHLPPGRVPQHRAAVSGAALQRLGATPSRPTRCARPARPMWWRLSAEQSRGGGQAQNCWKLTKGAYTGEVPLPHRVRIRGGGRGVSIGGWGAAVHCTGVGMGGGIAWVGGHSRA